MSAALNNIEVPDAYGVTPGKPGVLLCPLSSRLRMQINNQPIYWQRGRSPAAGQGVFWNEPEEFLLPGLYVFEELCDAIQFRAAIAKANLPEGQLQARVTVAARIDAELPAEPNRDREAKP